MLKRIEHIQAIATQADEIFPAEIASVQVDRVVERFLKSTVDDAEEEDDEDDFQ